MAYIELQYKSMALMRGVNVTVILPTDGMAGVVPEPPYKTLYMLPGYSATALELVTYLGLRAQAELKGMAIVIPDGENLFYQDVTQLHTFYSTYVGKELVEMTRKLFPLSDKREDTYIGGISMGGYGALYNGMKYRDTFSKVAAFSPACDPYLMLVKEPGPGFSKEQFTALFGSKEAYLAGGCDPKTAWCECPAQERPALFLCSGTEDRAVYKAVAQLEEALKEAGVPHTYIEEPGDHDFYFWESVLDRAFSFLTGIVPGTRDKLVCPDRME